MAALSIVANSYNQCNPFLMFVHVNFQKKKIISQKLNVFYTKEKKNHVVILSYPMYHVKYKHFGYVQINYILLEYVYK